MLTKEAVQTIANSRKLYFEHYLKRADQARSDTRRKQRRLKRECPHCYYVLGPRIVGQAFTAYNCQHCQQ